jgi:hypothetical protein
METAGRYQRKSRKIGAQAYNFLIGNQTGIETVVSKNQPGWFSQPINIVVRWVEFAGPDERVVRRLNRDVESRSSERATTP